MQNAQVVQIIIIDVKISTSVVHVQSSGQNVNSCITLDNMGLDWQYGITIIYRILEEMALLQRHTCDIPVITPGDHPDDESLLDVTRYRQDKFNYWFMIGVVTSWLVLQLYYLQGLTLLSLFSNEKTINLWEALYRTNHSLYVRVK